MLKVKLISLPLIIFLFCLVAMNGFSQNIRVFGKLNDKESGQGLIGVNVFLKNVNDSTIKVGTSTDTSGAFSINLPKKGAYRLRATYLGYQTLTKMLDIQKGENPLGNLNLTVLKTELQGVDVEDQMIRTQQKGDTTEHNAKSYKVNKDATAEDLVGKMPGITVENGTIKAQGEEVKKVTVDGQEFFGDDAALALRNLPAELVDKVQVYDRQSDQAQFTGFDDGNYTKTINIVTANGKNSGVFGKVYGGYGYLDGHRYNGGGNLNMFRKKQRISILGMSNNINQQNFSSQDLLGVTSANNSQMSGGGGPGGMGGGGRGGPYGGPGGGGGGGGSSNNFLVGQQGGINTTHSGGINYTDTWGKKIKIGGSYFFNNSRNATTSNKQRTYFLPDDSKQYYDESTVSESNNYNHRANLRFEYNIDTLNSLLITPKFSWQNNRSQTDLNGLNYLTDTTDLSSLQSTTINQSTGYNISNSLLFRHKFRKTGRTFSIDLGTTYNYKSGNNSLNSLNQFYTDSVSPSTSTNQITGSSSSGYNINPNFIYTEPLSKKLILNISYNPSYNKSFSDKRTNSLDSLGEYSIVNQVLSNSFNNLVFTQRAGAGLRFNDKKLNFMVGVNYQNLQLTGNQTYPITYTVYKSFHNVLPGFMFSYKFNQASTLRIFGRSSTNAPSVNQMQNVVDNSNPLQLSAGNPNLKQEYQNSLFIRYNLTKSKKGLSFFTNVSGTYTNNYIGSSTLVARADTTLPQNVVLRKGSQFYQPVNLNGYVSTNASLSLGIPLIFMKCNLNLNAGGSYVRTPSLVNGETNLSNTINTNGGFVLGSNISEKVDFTVSYTVNYNVVKNSLQPQLNNNYFYHLASAKLNLMPWKGLVINTNITQTYYTGLGSGFNQSFFLWNASLGYKFLKNRSAEIKVIAFDILNQNNYVGRTISGNYIEDVRTKVLNRYFMLGFTYNIRYFKVKPKPQG